MTRCGFCGESGHNRRTCPKRQSEPDAFEPVKASPVTFYSGGKRLRKKVQRRNRREAAGGQYFKCNRCETDDHEWENCPRRDGTRTPVIVAKARAPETRTITVRKKAAAVIDDMLLIRVGMVCRAIERLKARLAARNLDDDPLTYAVEHAHEQAQALQSRSRDVWRTLFHPELKQAALEEGAAHDQ